MSAPLVFLDTETTGLSLDDDIWEFAAIRREPDGAETELHMFIEHDRAKCARLPEQFRDDHYDRFRDHRAVDQLQAARRIGNLFTMGGGNVKPHVVGAVPNVDTERLRPLIALARWTSTIWHYHLIDVENLAAGYLAGQAKAFGCEFGQPPAPPWRSDDLAAALGVTIDESDRHTAMGDAHWAMRIYDAVMGRTA